MGWEDQRVERVVIIASTSVSLFNKSLRKVKTSLYIQQIDTVVSSLRNFLQKRANLRGVDLRHMQVLKQSPVGVVVMKHCRVIRSQRFMNSFGLIRSRAQCGLLHHFSSSTAPRIAKKFYLISHMSLSCILKQTHLIIQSQILNISACAAVIFIKPKKNCSWSVAMIN